MMKPTIGEVYRNALRSINNLESAKYDLRLMLCKINDIYPYSNFFVCQDQEIRDLRLFTRYFMRYLNKEPVEYIVNEAIFLGEKFYVDKRVLIPRVETEEVVLKAIEVAKETFKEKTIDVLDMCTGSAIIGITFLKHYKNANLTISDISKDALDVAKINLSNHEINAKIVQGDATKPFLESKQKFDIILANPPYIINEHEIDESVRNFEPYNALVDTHPLYVYESIFAHVKSMVKEGGTIVLEIGYDAKDKLEVMLKKYLPTCKWNFYSDINHCDRILIVYIL